MSDLQRITEFGELQTALETIAELEGIISKIKTRQSQLKLSKASTYHNEMGRLILELTGVHYSAYKEKQQTIIATKESPESVKERFNRECDL